MKYDNILKLVRGKTVHEVYKMLPLGNYKTLMVDECGVYRPANHKEKFGDRYVQAAGHWDDTVLYIQIHLDRYR